MSTEEITPPMPGTVCVLPREGRPAEETPVLLASPSIPGDSRDVEPGAPEQPATWVPPSAVPQHQGDREWSTSGKPGGGLRQLRCPLLFGEAGVPLPAKRQGRGSSAVRVC